MTLEMVAEIKSIGQLQGLILSWHCRFCEKLNIIPVVRKEAVSGERICSCSNCKKDSHIIFFSSPMISNREKIVEQALSFIPSYRHKIILEDLAWIEALFVVDSLQSFAKSYWDNLVTEINYWGQQEKYNE